MPIYEYQCGCGVEKELFLSFKDSSIQICGCGKHLQRKLSIPAPAIIRNTGKGMALDTLNDKRNSMPDRHWKPAAEKFAAAGL